MTEEEKDPEVVAMFKTGDELSDSTHQAIMRLSAEILKTAQLWQGENIDPRLSLNAMQHALSVLIFERFHSPYHKDVCNAIRDALVMTLKMFGDERGDV